MNDDDVNKHLNYVYSLLPQKKNLIMLIENIHNILSCAENIIGKSFS